MTPEVLAQQVLNALSLGAIYALLALGLAMVFSVLGLLNFAYGELITIVGYTMVILVQSGVGFWSAAAFGVVGAAAGSLLVELIAFRPLRGAPFYAVVFSSFAVSLIIQNLIRNLISPRPQGLSVPGWIDGVLTLDRFRFPMLSLVTLGVAIVAMILLSLFLRRSRHGLAIRAAAEDFAVTRLMGAAAGRMISLAFLLSGVLAGVAGVLWVARRGSADPAMGFGPLLQSFIAVVLGGMGTLRGAVYGGFMLAFIEVGLQVLLPPAVRPYTTALTMVAVVVVLYVRPHGLSSAIEERVA